jgi:hypothetical protein
MDSSCDTLMFFLFGIWSLWEGFKEDGYCSIVAYQLSFFCFDVSVIYLAKRCNSYFRDSDDLAEVKLNGNGALADADVRKKAEDAEAKRKAEEAEAEARRKKEDEERDAELTAYYQEQWANEDEGAAALLLPLLRRPRYMRQM